jgi:alkanesulfonate monooxygenase SsuD/methylene tetrahydromethanopterin reductase-like flavin-dependent oxidoreductase (luciferase family)
LTPKTLNFALSGRFLIGLFHLPFLIILTMNPQHYAAAKQLKEAADYAAKQVEKYQAILEQAEQAEARIAELDAQYAEAKRIADLNLSLAIKADKNAALTQLATELGVAVLTQAEHKALKGQIAEANVAQEAAVKAAIAQVYAENNANVNKLESAHKLATANLEAEKVNLTQMLQFFKEQVDRMAIEKQTTLDTAQKMVEAATRPAMTTVNSK